MDKKLPLCLLGLAAGLTLATPVHADTLDFGWAIDLAAPYVETALVAVVATLVGWLI